MAATYHHVFVRYRFLFGMRNCEAYGLTGDDANMLTHLCECREPNKAGKFDCIQGCKPRKQNHVFARHPIELINELGNIGYKVIATTHEKKDCRWTLRRKICLAK